MPELNLLDDLFRQWTDRIEHLETRLAELNLLESPSFPLSLTDANLITGIIPDANLIRAQGTWTPTFFGSTTAGVFTYNLQTGYYVRVGNIVSAWATLGITAIGTPPAGELRIGGLPVTAAAGYNWSVAIGRISQFNYAAAAMQLTAFVNAGGTFISLWESFDNGAVVAAPSANFTNAACQMIFSCAYLV